MRTRSRAEATLVILLPIFYPKVTRATSPNSARTVPGSVGPRDPKAIGLTLDPIDRCIVVVCLSNGFIGRLGVGSHQVAYRMGDWPYGNVPACGSRRRSLFSIPCPSAVALKDTLASRMGRTSLQPFPCSIPAIHPIDIAATAAPMNNFDEAVDGREENGGEARHGRASASVRGRTATPALRMSTNGRSIRWSLPSNR